MATPPPRRLRFGIQLPAQRSTWPDYLAAVRTVDDLGFDTLWTFDHLLPFAGPDDGDCFETWTTLAAMAGVTSRVRLGALVNGVLYRDPATLAKAAVQVDLISNGRLEFALGAAWAEREFRAYGLPFPPVAERLARLDEALEIVKLLWTQPRTTYEGRYYTIHDAPCEPKPVQRPHPPIMVGGAGRRTLRIAARHADEWNCLGSPAAIGALVPQFRAECAAIGRDPAEVVISAHPKLAIATSREEALAKARTLARANGQELGEEVGDWLLGTPAEIREQLQRFQEAGVTHWVISVGAPFDLQGLRLFADQVLPTFR
jgi:F420-dependent oxidoreductase-like protein